MRFLMAAFALALSCCGYHVAGHGDLMPKTIQTVCVPAFKNATSRQKLSDRLPEAISREFISRTISLPNGVRPRGAGSAVAAPAHAVSLPWVSVM